MKPLRIQIEAPVDRVGAGPSWPQSMAGYQESKVYIDGRAWGTITRMGGSVYISVPHVCGASTCASLALLADARTLTNPDFIDGRDCSSRLPSPAKLRGERMARSKQDRARREKFRARARDIFDPGLVEKVVAAMEWGCANGH